MAWEILFLRPLRRSTPTRHRAARRIRRLTQVDLARNFRFTGRHAVARQPARRGRTGHDEARAALGAAIAGVPEVATGHAGLACGPGKAGTCSPGESSWHHGQILTCCRLSVCHLSSPNRGSCPAGSSCTGRLSSCIRQPCNCLACTTCSRTVSMKENHFGSWGAPTLLLQELKKPPSAAAAISVRRARPIETATESFILTTGC